MVKRSLWFLVILGSAGLLYSQDMPPLPDNPSNPSTNNGVAPLPGQSQVLSASPALPDNSNTLPPLPDQSSTAPPAGNSGTSTLPPLPGQEAPATPSASSAAPSLPPLPGQETAPASVTSQPAPLSPALPEKPKAPKAKTQKNWLATKWRPNSILSGLVDAKGGSTAIRLSWVSQEILNSLEHNRFKFIKETGLYEGEGTGPQWREFEFQTPQGKRTLMVYIREEGKKVWLRVGPSEPPPPARYSIAEVRQFRNDSLKALGILKKKFGRRLIPRRVVSDWEASYNYDKHQVEP